MAINSFRELENDTKPTVAFKVSEAAMDHRGNDRVQLGADGVAPPNPDLELGNYARAVSQTMDDIYNGYGIPPEELDGPGLADVLGAAFRQENVAVNAIGALAGMFEGEGDITPLTPAELYEKIRGEGLDEYTDKFVDIGTVGEFNKRAAKIKQEVEDRKVLAAAGFGGMAASMLAGTLDVTTLIPFGAGAVRTAKGVAAAAAADAAVSEAGLHATQYTRTLEESASAVAMSAVLGGAIGTALHAKFGPKTSEMVDRRAMEAAADFQGAAGAARIRAWDDAVNKPVETIELQSIRLMDKVPGWIGDKLRNPFRALSLNENSSAARAFADGIASKPWISKSDIEGTTPSGTTVMVEYNGYTASFADVVHVADKEWARAAASFNGNRDQFGLEVTLTAITGERHAVDAVNVAADKVRAHPEIIKKSLIESGVFDEDLKVKHAKHYMPIVYDVENIRARKDEFIEFEFEAIRRELDNDVAEARLEWAKAQLQAQSNRDVIEQAKAEHDAGMVALREEQAAEIEALKTRRDGDLADTKVEADRISQGLEKLRAERNEKTVAVEAELKELRAARAEIKEAREEAIVALQGTEARGTEGKSNYRASESFKPELFQAYSTDEASKAIRARAEKVRKALGEADDSEAKIARMKEEEAEARAEAIKQTEKKRRAALRDARALYRDLLRSNQDAINAKLSERAEVKAQYDEWIKGFEADLTAERAAAAVKQDRVTSAYNKSLSKLKKDHAAALAKADEVGKAEMDKATAGLRTATDKPRIISMTKDELDAEARAKAQGIFDTLINNNARFVDHDAVGKSLSNYRKARTNPVEHADLVRRKFVKYDPLDLLEFYTRTAGMDAAMSKVYKRPVEQADGSVKWVGDPSLSGKGGVKDEIMSEYKSMIDFASLTVDQRIKAEKIKDPVARKAFEDQALGDNIKKLTDERDRVLRDVEVLRLLMRGGDDGGIDGKKWTEFAEKLGIINYMRLMGGTVLSSLGDPINIMISNGFGRTFKEGILPMIRDFNGAWKNADGDARRLTRLMALNMERELNRTAMDIADLGSPVRKTDPSTDFLRRLASRFSVVTGIQAWNSLWRQIAGRTILSRVLDNSVQGWDNLSAAERAWMSNNRLDASDLQLIKAAWEAQPRKHLPDGGMYPDVENWDPKAREAMFRIASQESVNNVIAPTPIDKMSMQVTPAGRLVSQFRSHMLANQIRLIGRQRALAMQDRGHAMQVYTGLFMLAAMGVVVDYLKHATGQVTLTGDSKGEPGKSPHDKWVEEFEANPFTGTFNALDRAGIFGVMMEADNLLHKTMGLGVRATGQYAFGEGKVQSSRTRNRAAVDVLFGPSVGLVNDTFTAFGVLDGEVERHEVKALRRLSPFQNMPILQQVLNEGEAQLGNIYVW